jgi:hypothetical protein
MNAYMGMASNIFSNKLGKVIKLITSPNAKGVPEKLNTIKDKVWKNNVPRNTTLNIANKGACQTRLCRTRAKNTTPKYPAITTATGILEINPVNKQVKAPQCQEESTRSCKAQAAINTIGRSA